MRPITGRGRAVPPPPPPPSVADLNLPSPPRTDGNGYVDFGQDDFDDAEYSGDEEPLNKRAKGAEEGAERKRGVFNNLAARKKKTATERVSSMFLGAGRDVIGPSKALGGAKKTDANDDALLEGLIGEIEHDPMGIGIKRPAAKRTAAASAVSAARPAMPQYKPNSMLPLGRPAAPAESGASTHDDYRRAPPRLSAADLCEDFVGDGGGPGASAADAAVKMEDVAAAEDFGAPAEDFGAPAADEADDMGDGIKRVVPWARKEAASTGLDWFAVVEDESGASSQEVASQPSAGSAVAGADGQMPPTEEDGSIRMYWIDAYEDQLNAPGTVYLFGKVKLADGKGFASCCVSLKGLERNLFVRPRQHALVGDEECGEPVEFLQVWQEVQALCKANRITRFGCKKVERSYAFEEAEVPHGTSSYLKLAYSAELPALPCDASGTYFSRIFGTSTSALELLLLKRRIMGPCWLKLDGAAPALSSSTWCKFELTLPGGKKCLSPLADPPPSPPLVIASLHIQTMLNAKHAPEVLLASVISHTSVSCDGATANPTALANFSVVRKPDGRSYPWDLQRTVQADKKLKLEICATERALLNYLVARLHSLDADVLVGHNIAAHDLSVLLQRLNACKIAQWSKVGRMRIKTMPRLSGTNSAFSGGNWAEWSVIAGRLMCDTYLSARELLPSQRSYSLRELARAQLGADKREIDPAQVLSMFEETSQLLSLVRCTENDAFLSLQLMFKMMVLPLTKQLTNLAGNLWTKSLQGKRAERIEYLLLHEFHKLKYLKPDKETYKTRQLKKSKAKAKDVADKGGADEEEEDGPPPPDVVEADDDDDGGRRGFGQSGRKKAAYAGGLVLEPKRGFYDKFVLLLDFNSLYPSIVQEYNICFTTVERPKADVEGNMPLAELPTGSKETGVLPRVIGMLVARRREVKALLKAEKDPQRKTQLDIRQKALKIMANSMYGCLGFSGSRFYCRALAELITSRGRDALMHAVEMAGNNNLEVIYGDTDSIMVHSNTNDLPAARKMADLLKREVNKHYRHMEIDIDGVMASMLLLKKKKYAALMVEEKDGQLVTTRETKGLDLVRRDWCTLSRTAGSVVLDFILSGKAREELVSEILQYLRGVAAQIEKNELGIEQYIITKALTKAPHDYPDGKNQPHVHVAKAMLEQGLVVAPGDVIEYVVCVDQSKSSVAERAYHPKTVLKAEGMLQIDTQWYLAQQLHPPIWRLCEPIDGLDSAQVAEALGLDGSKFQVYSAAGERDDFAHLGGASNELSKFTDAKPLSVKCLKCKQTHPFRGLLGQGAVSGAVAVSGEWLGARALSCSGCSTPYGRTQLQNALTLATRRELTSYYTAKLQCDEPSCREQSKGLSTHVAHDEAGMPLFPACTVPRCKGRMLKTYSDKQLHTQMLFFKSLFDTKWATTKIEADNKRRHDKLAITPLSVDEKAVFTELDAQASRALQHSAFDRVDLRALFSFGGFSGPSAAMAGSPERA